MSSDNYWSRFYLSPAIVVLNLFYYVFGRFTGMIIYFPSALFLLLLFFFQKKKPEDWFLLAAIGAAILFYILITPDNYFGGGGSLGNRYFFNIFPLFFFLGYRERTFRFSLLPVFAAVVFLAPVYMDSMFHSASPRFPGISFPAKFFPPEKTQYATLPSNTNPRAFNKQIGDKYTLFFLNDNFNPIEDESFWTYADKELELFLLAPRPVKTFHVQLKNIPLANQVRFQIEHKIQKVFIAADSVRDHHLQQYPRPARRPTLSVPHQDQKRPFLLPLFRCRPSIATSAGWACKPTSSWAIERSRRAGSPQPPRLTFGRDFLKMSRRP